MYRRITSCNAGKYTVSKVDQWKTAAENGFWGPTGTKKAMQSDDEEQIGDWTQGNNVEERGWTTANIQFVNERSSFCVSKDVEHFTRRYFNLQK